MSPYTDPEKKRTYQREWCARRRAELLGDAVCMRCGATDDLNLHHLVKDEKVSHRITTWARGRAEAEAAKCVVLCGPCHRELHADELRAPCGTDASYGRGCRCFACRAAHSEVGREWRERRRAA